MRCGARVMRSLPGLATLRDYEPCWLRHDLMAGLVSPPCWCRSALPMRSHRGCRRLRTVRDHRAAARLRPVRAQPYSGAGSGFLARPDHPRHRAADSGGDPMRAVALAAAMAVVSGLVCILAGVLRLGFLTELLSKPIRYGYMNGIALTVLISQLPKFLGFSIEADGPLAQPVGDRRRRSHRTVPTGRRLPLGAATLAVILLLKGSKRLPGVSGRGDRRHGRRPACSICRDKRASPCSARCPKACPSFAVPWIGYRRPRAGA